MSESKFHIDFSKSFPNLPGAPIVEAVVHWQSAASIAMVDADLAKLLSEKFGDYQIVPQQNVSAAFSGNQEGMSIHHSAAWDGYRLTKIENAKPVFVCQFKPSGLVFSRLAPYQGWIDFQAEGMRFWEAFMEIAKPAEIARLSTRFISQIPIKNHDEVAEYTNVARPTWSPAGSGTMGFFHQDNMALDDYPYIITITRALQPLTTNVQAEMNLIVDITVSTTDAVGPFDTMEHRLKELRFIKNDVFFTLMKDAETKFGETGD